MENLVIGKLLLICKIFNENDIDYCLAGGLAYSALVEPRSTIDIDMCILIENRRSIIDLLKNNFKDIFIHDRLMNFGQIKIQRNVVLEKEQEIIIDLLIDNSGKSYFTELMKNRIEIEFYNSKIKMISPEDLIILKTVSDREQDKIDIRGLKEEFQDSLNLSYISKWFEILKLEEGSVV